MVHEALQDVLLQLFPGSEVEVKIDLLPIGVDGSATVDIVLAPTDDSRPVVIEVKTINGFGFKKAATAFKGPAEGPRWGAIVQGALSAAALDADLIIAYLSLENLSPNLATSYGDGTDVGRFAAEWHFDHEAVKQIAADETARINRVLALTDAGVLAPRAIHDPEVHPGGVVTNPDTGNWMVLDGENVVGTGRTWMCGYCDHATKCAADGAGGATHAEDF
jgi:hypothetical protein